MSDHYDTLGVPRGATTSEIKRAYRALALRWHPDKNPGDREAAEAKFVAISAAAEVLCDDQKRAAYDRGGSAMTSFARPGGGFGGFDMRSAEAMFHASFGESLAASWQPGSRVSGTLVRDGKKVTVTIHPDGTSDEREEAASRSAGYSYVSRSSTGPGGGSFTSVHISGSLGQALADYLVPQSMQRATLSSADSQFRISTESSLALLILTQASPLGRLRHEPCDQPKNCSSLVRL
uniref:J domain-containing protein n=1 Tax=Emiliania huxleyi TaxID=2903 RepID=A0A7S3RQW5_EMIHU